jgi:LPS sulfotransferase NodH
LPDAGSDYLQNRRDMGKTVFGFAKKPVTFSQPLSICKTSLPLFADSTKN